MNIHSLVAFLYAIVVGKITDAEKISELEDRFAGMNDFFSFDLLAKVAEITKKVIELMRGYQSEVNGLENELANSIEMNELLRHQINELKDSNNNMLKSMSQKLEIIERTGESLGYKARITNHILNWGGEDELFALAHKCYKRTGHGTVDAFNSTIIMVQDIHPSWEYQEAREYLRKVLFVHTPTDVDNLEI